MGDRSMIEWTDATWNPVTGCTKVSQGCKHCYAEKVFPRAYSRDRVPDPSYVERDEIAGEFGPKHGTRPRRFTDVKMHPDRLDVPLRWKRPRRIFVNSMSDLFHEDVPDEFIAAVFGVMQDAKQHTFQVLTKRPERMLRWCLGGWRNPLGSLREVSHYAARGYVGPGVLRGVPWDVEWPLPNVWLGVSVEDQATADERIPLLLRAPAAVRFLSCEPLLGAIDLRSHLEGHCTLHDFASGFCVQRDHPEVQRIGWVIVGGESGRHGRPFDIAWARGIMAQCRAADVPVLVKQLGIDPRWNGHTSPEQPGWPSRIVRNDTGQGNWRPMLRDRKGGNMDEWPEDLRVREYPA